MVVVRALQLAEVCVVAGARQRAESVAWQQARYAAARAADYWVERLVVDLVRRVQLC